MRAVLLSFFWMLSLCVGAVAQGAELDPQIRSKAEAGDPYEQWQAGNFYSTRGEPGDLERSLDFYQRSLEGYRRQEGVLGKSLPPVMASIATTQIALGHTADGIATAENRVLLLQGIEPASLNLALATYDLGRIHAGAGNRDEALATFDDARKLYTIINGDPSAAVGSVLIEQGIIWYNAKQPEKALASYREALQRYRTAKDATAVDLAITLSNIAGVSTELGRHREAETARLEQIEVLRNADLKTADLPTALLDLGRVYQNLSRPETALEYYALSLDLFESLPNAAGEQVADVISGRGLALESLGKHVEALADFRDALGRYHAAIGDENERVTYTLGNIARASNELARYADAEAAGKQAVDLQRRFAPKSHQMAYALQELAITYQKLSKYREALPLVREARGIFLDLFGDMTSNTGDSYLNEGISLEGMKDFTGALKAHQEAKTRYAAAEGKDSLSVGYAINNTAWVYRRVERYKEADEAFRQALPILEKGLGPTHANTTKVTINIGIVARLLGNNDEAIRWSMRALTNLNRNADTTLDDQRWTYDTLAKAFKGRGDTRRAILFAKLAINAQQKIRSNNKEFKAEDLREFKDEWRFLYQDLADLLIGEGRLSEAQAVLNMEKEEELSDFVQRDASADLRDGQAAFTAKEDAEKGTVDTMLSQPIAAAAALTELVEKKKAAGLSPAEEVQMKELETSLDAAYSDFVTDVDAFLETAGAEDAGIQQEIDAINLDYTADAQQELRVFEGKAAMLQIASLSEATHLFLTVPDASIHREIKISRAELSRLVFQALEAIERRDPAVNDSMQALYKVLIEPVAGDLKASGAETLMLNLQGFLRYVPFAALYDGKRYLVEDYALSLYTPAARTEFSAADRAPDKSAGFGVTAGHPGFSPLPGVARELQAIFGGPQKSGALTGAASLDAAFTRDSFRDALKEKPSIVHIASHFKLVPGRETDSFLLLGDGSPLSLSDIRKGRGFRFGGVDLLTLSACETARGSGSEGDEVESFGALAQMNGASAVMATLWPVADEATASIMQSFYTHMVDQRMSKAEALRIAQIEAIRGAAAAAGAVRSAEPLGGPVIAAAAGDLPASHPYFWSPFVLMGNWL